MYQKKLNFVFTTATVVFLIFACQKTEIPTIDPELRAVSPKEQSLKIGETPTLQVQYYDQTGKINTQSVIAWVSSNPNVVSVDVQSGKLNPLKPGTVTITASVVANTGVVLRLEFTITVPIEGTLTISGNGDSPILIGAPIPTRLTFELIDQINTKLTPSNVIWSVAAPQDDPILSIDKDGVIKPLKPGITTVQLTVTHQNIEYKSSIKIEVIQEPTIEITNLNSEVKIENQNLEPLTVQYIDEKGQTIGATTGTIKWESNQHDILEIEENTGKLIPKKPGIATVSVTFELEGKQYSKKIEIEVTQEVIVLLPSIDTEIKMDGSEWKLDSIEFTNEKGIKETPDSFCWESSNTEVLKIDCQGNISLIKAGKVFLTLNISDDGKDYIRTSEEITITQDPVIHFEFPGGIPIEVIRTTQDPIRLRYRFIDQNGKSGTPESIEWKSSNSDALKIDSNGNLIALKADEVKISVLAYQNGVLLAQNELVIIVKQPAMVEIVNPPAQVSILQTKPLQLQIKYTDEDGKQTDPTDITWKSDDENILKVDEKGNLTPVAEGDANITVQIGDQGPTVSHTISVRLEVDPELELSQSSQTLLQGKSIPIEFTYRDKTGQPSSPQPKGTWSISNSNVIDFDENTGQITAISPGLTTISVTVEGLTEEITITVEVEPKFSVQFPSAPLQLGRDSHDLNPRFTDHFNVDRTSSQIISYENFEKSIISIDDNGVIRPVSTGQSPVLVKTVFEDQNYQYSTIVEIVSLTIQDVPELKISQPDYTLAVNFTNEEGTVSNPTVQWSSDFFEFAGGKLNLTKAGRNKTINASYSYKGGTYTASTTTSVTTEITFGIDSFDQTLPIPQNGGGSKTLSTTLSDEYGQYVSESNYQTTWASDDETIATIDNNGVLTPLSKGTVRISATATYDGQNYQSDSVSVEVEQPVLTLTSGSTEGIMVGDKVTFRYSFTNGNGGGDLPPSSVKWTEANSKGVFKATDVGVYEVELEVTYGGHTYEDSQELKVREIVITGKPSNNKVVVGGTNPDLDFNFKNEQGTITDVASSSWSLKDPKKSSVLTVDASTGQITVKSKGTATIVLKVTFDNQDYQIEYSITVTPPPSVNIDLESSTYEKSDFVWKGLNHWYLWQDQVSDLDDSKASSDNDYKRFIKQNSSYGSFFRSLLYKRGENKGDLYSYVTTVQDISTIISNAGFDNGLLYQLARVRRNTNNIIGVVLHAFPGTPAGGKVSRGDFFSHINGTRLTSSNYSSLLAANSWNLKMIDLQLTQDLDNPYAEVDLNKTVTISKQSNVSRNPIMTHSIITRGSHKVGYLAYYQFTRDASDLNAVFKTFADESITDLILDLRYNQGGYLSTAVALASMITGESSSSVFIKETYNSKLSSGQRDENFIDYLDTAKTVAVNKLNISDVYVLTSQRTASASEMVISGMSPYMNVTVIGQKTVGKHLATLFLFDHNDSPHNYHKSSGNINRDHNVVLNPVILSVTNSNGDSYGYDGFTPSSGNMILEELVALQPLGDGGDPLVRRALSLITGSTISSRYFYNQRNPLIPITAPEEGWLIKTFDR